MEYLEGGDLVDFLDRNGPMNEKLALKFLEQILSALAYCHKRGIAHRGTSSHNESN